MSNITELLLEEVLNNRDRRPRRYFREREQTSFVRRLEDMKREIKEAEELFKKKDEGKDKKNSLLTVGQWCFVLCFGTIVFGPFILWAQVVALQNIASHFTH